MTADTDPVMLSPTGVQIPGCWVQGPEHRLEAELLVPLPTGLITGPSDPPPSQQPGLSLSICKAKERSLNTPMFIAALFTIARTWKQPKCASTDEWIKKMWYIYAMEYYSAIKKNEVMPFTATWMDLDIVILSEVSQTKTNTIWYHLYVESKKMIQINLFTKQKQTHRPRKRTYGYQRGKVGGGIN